MTDPFRLSLSAALSPTYTIERELGGGGMSRVFVAEETRLGRRVVIKVLDPSLTESISADRFLREIAVAAALQDPHIVPVLTAGDANGVAYYTMPFVAGESLRKRLDSSNGRIAMPDAIAILRDVARALAYAHSHGVVHRDIKPDNVLLAGDIAVVTDFGIAKAIQLSRTRDGVPRDSGTLTVVGTSLGTPAYMAPEQAAGDALDHRVDIYAWGVMAYELLSGRHPFAGRTTAQQLIAAHIAEAPAPLGKDVPRAVAALVMRALAKNPAERPQTATELVAALEHADAPIPRRHTSLVGQGLAALGILALVAGAVWTAERQRHPAVRDTTITSVAVLPFVNASGDSSEAYFSEGMAEEVSGVLAKIPALRVASRRAVDALKDRNAPPQEIARTLGVRALLDGTVRRAGNRVRVKADLTSADSGTVLWTHTYEQPIQDVFALQDSIAASIAQELRVVFTGSALAASRAGRTTNPEAHDLYLRGMQEYRKVTEAGTRAALDYYQRAAAVDPQYAMAYVGIADSWTQLADAFVPAHEAYPKAVAAAQKALGIDSMLAEAHTVYGYASLSATWNIPKGKAELERGAELDPNSAIAAMLLANMSCYATRDTVNGLSQAERAVKLDPTDNFTRWTLALCQYDNGRYDEAIATHTVITALDSNFFYLHDWGAESMMARGDIAGAIAIYERARRLWPRPIFPLAYAYAKAGRTAEGRKIATDLEHLSATQYVDPNEIAFAYAGVGDADNAMKWFARAEREHAPLALGVWTLQEVKPISGDPRFKAFLARIDSLQGKP